MWRIFTPIFALLALCACTHTQRGAGLVAVCQGYNDTLVRAAKQLAAGQLSAPTVIAITAANDVVIGDPAHGKPGICTTSVPTENIAQAIAIVEQRMNAVKDSLAHGGGL